MGASRNRDVVEPCRWRLVEPAVENGGVVCVVPVVVRVQEDAHAVVGDPCEPVRSGCPGITALPANAEAVRGCPALGDPGQKKSSVGVGLGIVPPPSLRVWAGLPLRDSFVKYSPVQLLDGRVGRAWTTAWRDQERGARARPARGAAASGKASASANHVPGRAHGGFHGGSWPQPSYKPRTARQGRRCFALFGGPTSHLAGCEAGGHGRFDSSAHRDRQTPRDDNRAVTGNICDE